MENESRFAAPWSPAVKIITVTVVVLLLGVSFIGTTVALANAPFLAKVATIFIPLAILAGTLPFMIRGYVLRDDELLIKRLGWRNRVPLNTVVSATPDPEAIRGSIRIASLPNGTSGAPPLF